MYPDITEESVPSYHETDVNVSEANEVSIAPPVTQQDDVPVPRKPPRCGWCCWRPNFLQPIYRWPTGMILICAFSLLRGFVINGFSSVNTAHLERRFRVGSLEIGGFNSVQDLSAAASALVFSYLADRAHKPRWLMVSAIMFAIGCFVMSLPHYIAEPYNGNDRGESNLCAAPTSLSANLTKGDECSDVPVSSWLNVLIAGNAISGIGLGMIFTIGLAFIDDISSKRSSSFNIGITYLFVSLGAAAGFGGGVQILQLDVNFNRPDWPQFKGNKDFNPNFVGAWWLGYAISAGGFVVIALCFSCFDYEMPETAVLRQQKPVETHRDNITFGENLADQPRNVQIFLRLLRSILKLAANPVLVFVTLSSITHGLIADGLTPFFVKILRTQFVMNESKIGLALSVLIIVAIGMGNLLSGWIVKKGDLSVRGLILLVLVFDSIGSFLGFGYFIRCSQEKIAGVTISYGKYDYYNSIPPFDPKSLANTCNARCGCSPDKYQPVCHPKLGIQFFSPCHGGCRVERSRIVSGRNISIYLNCDCFTPMFFQQQNMTLAQQSAFMQAISPPPVAGNITVTNVSMPPAAMLQVVRLREAYQNFSIANVVANGACDTSCPEFYGAMVNLFLALFCGFFCMVPVANIVMRCVEKEDRTFALAFYNSIQRFLGSIPGPIMMGAVLDKACLFREPSKCGDEGACMSYNAAELSRLLAAVCVGVHCAGIVFYVFALVLYKSPNGDTLKDFFLRRNIKPVVVDSQVASGEGQDNSAYQVDPDLKYRSGISKVEPDRNFSAIS